MATESVALERVARFAADGIAARHATSGRWLLFHLLELHRFARPLLRSSGQHRDPGTRLLAATPLTRFDGNARLAGTRLRHLGAARIRTLLLQFRLAFGHDSARAVTFIRHFRAAVAGIGRIGRCRQRLFRRTVATSGR